MLQTCVHDAIAPSYGCDLPVEAVGECPRTPAPEGRHFLEHSLFVTGQDTHRLSYPFFEV